MDLNGWTGKTYVDPPFWVALKVSFGAHRWRCEYCRLNFASFRPRKEVFTFKRWKKFGEQVAGAKRAAGESPASPTNAEREGA